MGIRQMWVDALYRAATSTGKTRSLLTPFSLSIFGVVTTAFVVAAVVVDGALDLPQLMPPGVVRLSIALVMLVIGIAVTGWSAIHFLRVGGTPVPFNPPPRLVVTGPYRYVRNPMLTGVFIVLLGIGLLLGSFSLVFVFMPLFVLANVWELKTIEEPELEKRLGNEYAAYRAKTRMFLPTFKVPPSLGVMQ